MQSILPPLYFILSICVIFVDLYIAYMCNRQKSFKAKALMRTCIFSALVEFFYMLSASTDNYFFASLHSSMYFISVSLAVNCLFIFIVYFTKTERGNALNFIWVAFRLYFIFDAAVMLINPFKEITLSYVSNDAALGQFEYRMKPLFYAHLIYCYIVVAMCLFLLIRKAMAVPKAYRGQYSAGIFTVLVIVFWNAVFLYLPEAVELQNLDYSIWGYSIGVGLFYYNCFYYAKGGMLNQLKDWIIANVDQGIVLFDYEGLLVFHNEMSERLLPDMTFSDDLPVQVFIQAIGLPTNNVDPLAPRTAQFFNKHGMALFPLRCDYHPYLSDNQALLGRLFVFTDTSNEKDLLTGFESWDKFKISMGEQMTRERQEDILVSICDINGLQQINAIYGRTMGDRVIHKLSGLMRENYPKGTHFVRGHEAYLIAITTGISETECQNILRGIEKEFSASREFDFSVSFQSAMSAGNISDQNEKIVDVIRLASKSVQAKKLLDSQSAHSEILTSLVQALQEADPDTEEHVKRTQILGDRLGKRLGLSDSELSDLSLLCILHDIGKIGVPVEILNKPERLSLEEWEVLKSHAEKGAQIASASQEFAHIADMIRHHHERWDGKGYPSGYSKETIPLLSRIIAVVDAYDAMVNDRSYRPAMTSAEARMELRKCAGTQFDPSITSELLQLLEEDAGACGRTTAEFLQDSSLKTSDETAEDDKSRLFNSVRDWQFDQPDEESRERRHVFRVEFARYILDERDRIIVCDENFTKLTGYTVEEVFMHRMTQLDLIFPEDMAEYSRMLGENMKNGALSYFEHRIRRKDGTECFVLCFGKLYYDSAAKERRSEIIVTENVKTHSVRTVLTQQQIKAEQRLNRWEMKFRSDSLTGLLTQEALRNDVEAKLLQGYRAMLIMMDVDRFKEYNDTHGHQAGDEFLIRFAKKLESSLRKNDLACRMGGDEFAAVLFFMDPSLIPTLKDRAQQICDKMNAMLTEQNAGASLSMGVSVTDDMINNFHRLYETADKALYRAKNEGRARLKFYAQ